GWLTVAIHGPNAVNAQTVAGSPIVWVELGPSGAVIARVITTDMTCPHMTLGSTTESMQVRAQPSPPDYPVLVCEATIPSGVASASVGGQALPLPKPSPSRIVVIGDAGCRISADKVQACNDPQAWPFERVANSAAAFQPDLVIHVGDLLYREEACPVGNAGCVGSPFGYNFAAMNADFFTPAAALLRAAPWVFTRGNHELCSRNGAAWFRLFDPRPMPANCQDFTDPYAIAAGDIQLLLFDSSIANDLEAQPDQVAIYAPQFAALHNLAQGDAWLLTHRPMWSFGHAGIKDGVEELFRDNPTLQAASQNALPSHVQLVLSGHIHLLELLSFSGGRPPQFVVGNSGTLLDPTITTPLPGLEIAGATVTTGPVIGQFGFLTMERSGRDWIVTARDVNGAPQFTCTLSGAGLTCLPVPVIPTVTPHLLVLVAAGFLVFMTLAIRRQQSPTGPYELSRRLSDRQEHLSPRDRHSRITNRLITRVN
ncbi:MAG: metallophosphoesterase family protein, partial [bacterium]